MTEEQPQIRSDIEVLREMVRLAENRRDEAFRVIEKANQYNLALIAFAGTFLSLLVTADFERHVVQFAGISLICSILISLATIRPQKIFGGAPDVTDDVKLVRQGHRVSLENYLLDVADITKITVCQTQQRLPPASETVFATAGL